VRFRIAVAGVAALVAVAGCASLPTTVTEQSASIPDRPFAIDGRLAARHGADGIAGSFTWLHEPGHDAIDLADPLGQTIARLDGNRREVKLALANGSVETASDWPSLTERGLGVAIPVEGLASWIQGSPRAGASANVARDAEGRPSALSQDGWDVRYRYADDSARRPQRVTLAYPDSPPIDLTIVIDRWR
jgi:outer membrane lipoprotein LolB